MSEDNNANKKKRKFNIFDIGVMCFILVFIFVLFYFSRNNLLTKKNDKIIFTINLLCVDKDFGIAVGDLISDSVNGIYYGKISEIKSKPAEKIIENNNLGEFVISKIPDKVDLEVSVECDATNSKKSISINKRDIKIGNFISLKTKGCAFSGYIIDIKKFDRKMLMYV